jgi:hypothetical protein
VWDSMVLVQDVGIQMREVIRLEPSCMFNRQSNENGVDSHGASGVG